MKYRGRSESEIFEEDLPKVDTNEANQSSKD